MKKISNKVLIIALLALITLFVLARVFRSPGLESNLRKGLVSLDTAKVTEIRILPSNARDQVIKLLRSGENWTVEKEGRKHTADASSIKDLLGQIRTIDAERMVSRKKEKWETFNVGEKSTNVSVYYGSDLETNIHIGKSGFNQAGGSPYGGDAYTYARLSDEDEVYVVNGFYEGTFNRAFNDWRNKALLRLSREDINKISFQYPDSGFVVEKKDTVWYANGQLIAKSKIENYLGHLTFKNVNAFDDGFVPTPNPDAVIKVEGANGALASIDAWRRSDGWVLQSSQQSGVFFSTAGSTIAGELLVGQKHFLAAGQ